MYYFKTITELKSIKTIQLGSCFNNSKNKMVLFLFGIY